MPMDRQFHFIKGGFVSDGITTLTIGQFWRLMESHKLLIKFMDRSRGIQLKLKPPNRYYQDIKGAPPELEDILPLLEKLAKSWEKYA